MAKISTNNTSNKFSKLYWIIPMLIFIIYKGYNIYERKNPSNQNSEQTDEILSDEILSKEEHLLTADEWKKIADYRAQEFYECTKNLAEDLESYAVYEYCAKSYNNNWVLFRMGLDEKANLNDNQIEMLKDYWHKTRDAMTEKVQKIRRENEKKLRPNKYN